MDGDRDVVVSLVNVVKRFKVGHARSLALSTEVDRLCRRTFFRKEVSEKNADYKFAVNNVSLDVRRGQTCGIMGHNAAGKSTLLKLIANITKPTSGEIVVRGRVAPLLEVGAGFHPEFTGRENVFLNGVLLGMKYRDIQHAFDEIVSFAGVEDYIDVPLKKYSSGMVVRLGFSIAVHSNPQILLVDEVLAVGDADFQKKCLERIDEFKKDASVTIIFVSHHKARLQKICDVIYLFDHGSIVDTIYPSKTNGTE